MQFGLTIILSQSDIDAIKSTQQQITLVKSNVSNPLTGNNLPVAWISFMPWEGNTVTWQEQYEIYASASSLQSGATIVQMSSTNAPVQLGWTYTLEGGDFAGAVGGGSNTFSAENQQGGTYSFGLAQSAVVNGVSVTAPLNAIPVANNETVSFTPEQTLSIFLSTTQNNGVVLSQVAGNALTVSLSSQTPTATIGFNSTSSTFYQT